ncbi:MAG TPA: PaaI family thioesterase, partial [Ktedonobacteraceae bacterium]
DFRPKAEHQGFPGIIHGGIVASVLDETLNRTCALSKNPAWSMTGRLEVRYRQYVPFGPLLRVRAKLDNERGRLLQASGSITLADDESKVLAEAQGTFMALSPEMDEMIMRDHPEMKDFFKNQA